MEARPVKVAALYVEENGCYAGLPDVDVWGISRDARLYSGNAPVVAHPPCERWGMYAEDAIGAARWNRPRKRIGDDGGCFRHALESVRKWGGVLEHPCASKAWAHHGLIGPPRSGGWVAAGDWVGWTCCVEQGHYGHRARKATWLYACVASLPSLCWGASHGGDAAIYVTDPPRNDPKRARVKVMGRKERMSTPLAFRDLLLSIARTGRKVST